MGKLLRVDSRDIFATQYYIESRKVLKNLVMKRNRISVPPFPCIQSKSGRYLIINGHTRAALDELFSDSSLVYVPSDSKDFMNYSDFPDVFPSFIDEENLFIDSRWYDALSHDNISLRIGDLRKRKLLLKSRFPALLLARIAHPIIEYEMKKYIRYPK